MTNVTTPYVASLVIGARSLEFPSDIQSLLELPMKKLLALTCAALFATPLLAQDAKVETVVTGLTNPCGIAIQPETGHVFISDSGAGRVVRIVDGKIEEVIKGSRKDIYGKGPMYDVGPMGLAFLDKADRPGKLWIEQRAHQRRCRRFHRKGQPRQLFRDKRRRDGAKLRNSRNIEKAAFHQFAIKLFADGSPLRRLRRFYRMLWDIRDTRQVGDADLGLGLGARLGHRFHGR